MFRPVVLIVVFSASLASVALAQQDERLEKATEKFQKDMDKANEAFIAGLDKAILQAGKTGNVKLQQKLGYDKSMFIEQHLVPREYPSDTYLVQRNKATVALMKAYQPTINELTKAKKFEEANALEDALSKALTSARGYGVALPDLGIRPIVMIENVKTGQVIDTLSDGGTGELVLNVKLGARRPTQCWRVEREEKGFVFINVKSNHNLDVFGGNKTPGHVLSTWPYDRKKETGAPGRFKLTEVRRELVIESDASGLVLTATDRVVKGVTTTYVTQEKKGEQPLPTQLWKVVEVK